QDDVAVDNLNVAKFEHSPPPPPPRGVASVAATPATCPLVPGEKIALSSVRSSVSRGRLSDGFGTAPYPSASPPGPFPLSLTLRGTKGFGTALYPSAFGRRYLPPLPAVVGDLSAQDFSPVADGGVRPKAGRGREPLRRLRRGTPGASAGWREAPRPCPRGPAGRSGA